MPYTPTPLDLVTPADSNHDCFQKVNENFEDINQTLIDITALAGQGFNYFKTALVGGTSAALDSIDGDDILDSEIALVAVGNNPAQVYIYTVDADNAGTEDSPYIIAPDTNAGDKRWILAARIPRTWKGASSPTVSDDAGDGVRNGDVWIYNNQVYLCASDAAGAAVWRLIPQLGTTNSTAALGDHNHSTVTIASTAISDWIEAVQDSAGGMWTGNTETGLSITYDNSTGKLNASVTYGTDANTACQGNDVRLSDSRIAVSHTHTESEITDLGAYAASDHSHDSGDISSAIGVKALSFNQGTSSPSTLIDPPNDTVITKIVVIVDSAASAGSPTISIGIATDTDRDMDEADSDIKVAGTYIVEPYTACGTDGDNVIMTITPDSQTFSGRCYVHYVVPV